MNKIKRALISVWDKNGIIELAEFLFQNNIGWQINFNDNNCILLPLKKLDKVMFDEITITSSFSLFVIDEKSNGFSIEDISDVIVKASKVNGEKCQRCWKYEAKLINDEVCNRCNTVIFK